MQRVVVAAGGGGDAVGAAMLAAAWWPHDTLHILTYAWERVAVDPRAGPRGRSDFDHLQRVGRRNWLIPGTACGRPPGRSLLPRLAALGPALYLIDPRAGPAALGEQAEFLMRPTIGARPVTGLTRP